MSPVILLISKETNLNAVQQRIIVLGKYPCNNALKKRVTNKVIIYSLVTLHENDVFQL